jgi:hypothetical protein
MLVVPASPAAAVTWAAGTGLVARPIADGFDHPVHVASPPGDPRLFVVEQTGRVRVIKAGRTLGRPFLDLTRQVRFGGERGLLSIAFHPRYAATGWFFVNYTDRDGTTRIERYRASSDPDVADPSSARLVLEIPQPFQNHNGGHMLFGPDTMLWIGMGDGGSAGDPYGHGQNRATLLGKILRVDVGRGAPYAIPPDNPWPRAAGTRPEIWALGTRNPWRMWIDPAAGLLYVADVGQNRWEEVHVVPLAPGGRNLGWNLMEGGHGYRNPAFDRGGLDVPAVEYEHDDGCSITGGIVYRGRRIPSLVGHYLFADYCRGWIRSVRWSAGRATSHREWRPLRVSQPVSFGIDPEGEVLVVSHTGTIYRLDPASR